MGFFGSLFLGIICGVGVVVVVMQLSSLHPKRSRLSRPD